MLLAIPVAAASVLLVVSISFEFGNHEMLRILPLAAAFVLITSLTYVQGKFSHRWSSDAADAKELAKYIDEVPMNVGDWEGTDRVVTDDVLRVAGAAGHLSRDYQHKQTGQRVKVWLICGRPQDMIIHNPQICYPGQGYTQHGQRRKYSFVNRYDSSEPSEFFTAAFRKEAHEAVTADRVYWAFAKSDDPVWKAPTSVRLTFPGVNTLYKLYFTCQTEGVSGSNDDNAATRFGHEFIPAVSKVLFSRGDQADPAASESASGKK